MARIAIVRIKLPPEASKIPIEALTREIANELKHSLFFIPTRRLLKESRFKSEDDGRVDPSRRGNVNSHADQ